MSTSLTSSEEHHLPPAVGDSKDDESEREESEGEGDERESGEIDKSKRDESDDEHQEIGERLINKFYGFLDYAIGFDKEKVSLEGLQSRIGLFPADFIAEKILEYNILHHYVTSYALCQPEGGKREAGYPPVIIELEVVQYLLELAPLAVYKADDGTGVFGKGAYPLHLACFNANCPVSVIKLLFEENPKAIKHSWEEGHGLPLRCYLARACKHETWGHNEDDEDGQRWVDEIPSFASAELDHEVVKMLFDAYPEGRFKALDILCDGYDVSLGLVKLLTNDGADFNLDADVKTKFESSIRSLLSNRLVVPFPTDVFRYLLEGNPTSLEFVCTGSENPLNIACANPNMSTETIRLIIESHPELVKLECKWNGCLPLHALCKNKELRDQSSIDILKLLVNAYPESVKKKVGDSRSKWAMESEMGKLPISLAEKNMSFSFCKALLSECARQC